MDVFVIKATSYQFIKQKLSHNISVTTSYEFSYKNKFGGGIEK